MLIHVKALFHVSLNEIRPRLAEPLGVTIEPPQNVGADPRGKISLWGSSHELSVLRRVLLCYT